VTFLSSPSPALVSRPLERSGAADQYLILGPQGAARWTIDPSAATTFDSMREATRAALHLPSGVRAYGLPLRSIVADRWALN
jgi:hypothetical protein